MLYQYLLYFIIDVMWYIIEIALTLCACALYYSINRLCPLSSAVVWMRKQTWIAYRNREVQLYRNYPVVLRDGY